MSCKAKIAAAAATFALAGGGLGMLGTLSASAATPRCGSSCQDLSTLRFGHRYLLATFQGTAAAGQEVILRKASNRAPAEDFVIKKLGSVGSSYGHYALSAYEFQYAPYGVNSNLCLGTLPGQVAQAGSKVLLEPCGKHRNTVWAVFTGQFAGDHTTRGYDVLISAATDSFADGEHDTRSAQAQHPGCSPADARCLVVPGRILPGRKIVNGHHSGCRP